ncbi:spore coat protein [Salipaludibacillus agaradhaerens]|jgi:similar to spore coat protein|uniref:spore coat protein n=1 Tax=Salipaludibacillus agaradhaerens TaxID=76935 RepID=UPI0021508C4B|nr:spore coat protein [Salipaludibacillus agaradhaerens]MCR6104924.1 spore coat protein [Salipaludibacillus agaradhaerens]MCR6116971.1 spore coat protein [Salipaludibacillus agaradhaerens]
MNQILEKLTGMTGLTDQVIATDLLVSAKSGIKNYALAITETASPQIRKTLMQQLEDEIALHQRISNYMIDRGYYHPHNTGEQQAVDLKTAEAALNLAKDH